MKVSNLSPIVSDKIEFDPSKTKFIPENVGCYVLTNYGGDILYIGQAKNLKKRISQHLNDARKINLTELGKVYYVYYKVLSHEEQLNKLERGWINCFEIFENKIPILNSVRGPI